MKRIICSFNCFLQDKDNMHNVRHIDLQQDRTVYMRSNDIDGETRYYTKTFAEFEVEFKVNLLDYLTSADMEQFDAKTQVS